jgi:hypothetical protein
MKRPRRVMRGAQCYLVAVLSALFPLFISSSSKSDITSLFSPYRQIGLSFVIGDEGEVNLDFDKSSLY